VIARSSTPSSSVGQPVGDASSGLTVRTLPAALGHQVVGIPLGPAGLLRRHDYAVDILGGTTGANYALNNREVDGIVVPTRRRVYGYDGDHEVVREPVLVAIDMGEIAFS